MKQLLLKSRNKFPVLLLNKIKLQNKMYLKYMTSKSILYIFIANLVNVILLILVVNGLFKVTSPNENACLYKSSGTPWKRKQKECPLPIHYLLPIHYSFNSVFLWDTCIGEPVNFCVSFPSSGIGYVHINFHAILCLIIFFMPY